MRGFTSLIASTRSLFRSSPSNERANAAAQGVQLAMATMIALELQKIVDRAGPVVDNHDDADRFDFAVSDVASVDPSDFEAQNAFGAPQAPALGFETMDAQLDFGLAFDADHQPDPSIDFAAFA